MASIKNNKDFQMKKIYTFFLLFAVCTSILTAQNSSTKKADQFYDRLNYTDAVEAYQKLIKDGDASPYVYERLANTYFFINNTKNAETYYAKVVKGKNTDAETIYNYAQSLKANGKVAEYNTWMQNFAKMKPADSRAIDFMKNPNYIPKIMEENRDKFNVTKMDGINSKYSDFGGNVSGNDFYFASGRNTSRKTYSWNNEPYLDIYKVSLGSGKMQEAKLVDGDVNTKYHESTPVITAPGIRMYFDRNDYFKGKFDKSEEGINQINLYYARYVEGMWKDVQEVPFNSKEYSTGHPALSPDGKTLYFVSDKPGGKGKSDIYKVAIDAQGGFGTPTRLGDNINTEGKEVFPFMDANGTLYFSSDGQLGIGGLDVFSAEASGNDFGEVKNLGGSVNSKEDDFAFSINASTGEGYVSSNRPGGLGSDDIYKVNTKEICEVDLIVKVIDEYTKNPLVGAIVDLYDDFENKLKSKTTDAEGNVSFVAECNTKQVVQGTMKEYEGNSITIDPSPKGNLSATLILQPLEELIVANKVVLKPILFDYDRYNIKSQAAFELDKLVALMKKYPNMVINIEGHTDNRGSDSYNLLLSDKRAKAAVQYVISKGIGQNRISGEGFGESRPVVACGDNCTEEQHQQNRRSEFIIVKK